MRQILNWLVPLPPGPLLQNRTLVPLEPLPPGPMLQNRTLVPLPPEPMLQN
jgi:hypothetical protein